VLNEKWRIIDLYRQWVLQKKKGRKTKKSSIYRSKKFHKSREVLKRSIRECCGIVSSEAQAIVGGFREHYPVKKGDSS